MLLHIHLGAIASLFIAVGLYYFFTENGIMKLGGVVFFSVGIFLFIMNAPYWERKSQPLSEKSQQIDEKG